MHEIFYILPQTAHICLLLIIFAISIKFNSLVETWMSQEAQRPASLKYSGILGVTKKPCLKQGGPQEPDTYNFLLTCTNVHTLTHTYTCTCTQRYLKI